MEKECLTPSSSITCEKCTFGRNNVNKFDRIEELVCDENSFYDEVKFEEMLELYYFMDNDQKSCFKAFMKLKEAKKEEKLIKEMKEIKERENSLVDKINSSLKIMAKTNSNLNNSWKELENNAKQISSKRRRNKHILIGIYDETKYLLVN